MTFSNSILAGNTLVREAIQSENYEPGTAGWSIERDGDAEFNNITARGNITATSVDVQNPNDATHHTFIKPSDPNDLSGGAGIPEFRQQYFGSDRVRIGAEGSSDGNVILGIPNNGEYYAWIRGSSVSGRIVLGRRGVTADHNDSTNKRGEIKYNFVDTPHTNSGIPESLIVEALNDTGRLDINPVRHTGAGALISLGKKTRVGGDLSIGEDAGQSEAQPELRYGRPFAGIQPLVTRHTGNTVRSVDVGPFTTTETIIDSVVADVVDGRRYCIEWDGHGRSTIAGDRVTIRIRENDIAGTIVGEAWPHLAQTANASNPLRVVAQWDAVFGPIETTQKTFVVTMVRAAGTGDIRATGSSTQRVFTKVIEIGKV